MAGDLTGGFDILVETTENALNEALDRASVIFAEATAQREISVLGPLADAPFEVHVVLENAQVAFTASADELAVTADLEDGSSLTLAVDNEVERAALITAGVPASVPLAGTVTFEAPLEVEAASAPGPAGVQEAGLAVVCDMPNGQMVGHTVEAEGGLGPLSGVGNAIDAAIAEMASELADEIGALVLTRPVESEIAALSSEVLDAAAGDATRALGIGMSVFEEGAGSFASLTTLPGLSNTAVLVSNLLLFGHIEDALREALDGGSFDVDRSVPSLSWTGEHSHDLPESDDPWAPSEATIEGVEVRPAAEGLGFEIEGTGNVRGSCYTADFTFSSSVSVSCDEDGLLDVVVGDESTVVVEPEIDWGCVVLVIGVGVVVGAVVGAITGAIIGAIVGGAPGALTGLVIGGIVGAIVGGVVAAIALWIILSEDHTTGVEVTGLVGVGDVDLPLPVGTDGLAVEQCTLDDLELRGAAILTDCIPIASEGSRRLDAGETINLDSRPPRASFQIGRELGADVLSVAHTGLRHEGLELLFPMADPADLRCEGNSLTALDGARIAITALPYAELTLADLQTLSYQQGMLTVGSGIKGRRVRTFGVRTSAGRYARCQATRLFGGGLQLAWTTYEDPAAEVLLSSRIEVTSQRTLREVDRTITIPGPGESPGIGSTTYRLSPTSYSVNERAQRALIEARPLRLVPPLAYRWRVAATAIPEVAGTTEVGELTVRHHGPHSRRLILEAPQGTDLRAKVCVTVTDAEGRVIERCTSLNSPTNAFEPGGPQAGKSFRDALRTLPLGERDLRHPPIGPGPDPDPSLDRDPGRDGDPDREPSRLADAIAKAMG